MEPKIHQKKLMGIFMISWLIAGADASFQISFIPLWVQGVLFVIGFLSIFISFYRLHRYGQWLVSQS